MGHSHGREAGPGYEYEQDEDDDSVDTDDDVVDRLAFADHQKLILEVVTPRRPEGYLESLSKDQVLKNGKAPLRDLDDFHITTRTVLLHVYDLESFENINAFMTFNFETMTLGGAFHAGVEVFRNEWSYGKRGVCSEAPRTAEGHVYRCSIPLAETTLTAQEVASVLLELCATWRGPEYDILTHNCCSFAAAFCSRLGVGDDFPLWIDRFARVLGRGQKGLVSIKDGVESVAKSVVGMVREGAAGVAAEIFDEDGLPTMRVPGQEATIQVQGDAVRLVRHNAPTQRRVQHAAPLILSRVLLPSQVAPAPKEAKFRPGASVEYKTAANGWMLTEVVSFEPSSGLYNLKCKLQVCPSRIRAPAPKPRYAVGEKVEYYSTTHQRWVDATVCEVCLDCYNLDCKGGATEDRLRKPSSSSQQALPPPGLSESVSLPPRAIQRNVTVSFEKEVSTDATPHLAPHPSLALSRNSSTKSLQPAKGSALGTTPVGTLSLGTLGTLGTTPMGATPVGTTPAGTHNSNVGSFSITPMGQQASAVSTMSFALPCDSRAGQQKASESNSSEPSTSMSTPREVLAQKFPIEADVEYLSASLGYWIKATVHEFHPDGTYDLSVKQQADPARIRWPPPLSSAAAPQVPPTVPPAASPRTRRQSRVTIFSGPEDLPPETASHRKEVPVPYAGGLFD